MHFHSRCNVNFICSSIMSLHIKFRCGLGGPNRQRMESASRLFFVFLELSMHFFFFKYKQTMFS